MLKALPWKIILIILLVVGLFGAIQSLWFTAGKGDMLAALEKTRQELRRQGFKVDLSEFNFSTSTADQSRAAAITFHNAMSHSSQPDEPIIFLPTAGDDSALVIWRQDWVKTGSESTDWAKVRAALSGNWFLLDEACAAVLAGPIRFDLDAKKGSAMLLRHLGSLKNLSQSLGARTVLELHDGHPEAAWSNLLVQTRLVTAWETEPCNISYLVRFSLSRIAFETTWQALQYDRWPDEKLAALQREWSAVNFFTNLPETAAFERASAVQACEWFRQQASESGIPFNDLLKEARASPTSAWRDGKAVLNRKKYAVSDVFDDERSLLLYFQKRELELRAAVAAPDWRTMRGLAGATNPAPFASPHHSQLEAMLNVRSMGLAMQFLNKSLLARAAEAETHRRIICTAIALERFRNEHGAYPKSLAEISENFLPLPPVDFMDDQPLRYQLAADGRFLLYSVGLDGTDDGGKMPAESQNNPFTPSGRRFGGTVPNEDMVWPRAATAEAVASLRQTELAEVSATAEAQEMSEAAQQWSSASALQAEAESVLSRAPDESINQIKLNGTLLSARLQNTNAAETNALTLLELLTLRRVATDGEPEAVTFDVPMNYEALTNLGQLNLYVDCDPKNISENGINEGMVELNRATNGNCLLVWNTIYEAPGKHALTLVLSADEPDEVPATLSRLGGRFPLPPPFMPGAPRRFESVAGPALPLVVSNLCEFSLGSSHYDTNTGAILHARLPEANARYIIELNTTNGVRLKTITGTTANGEIRQHWNLLDEQGKHFTGGWFNSVFHITLPDSGRTQTLKGP